MTVCWDFSKRKRIIYNIFILFIFFKFNNYAITIDKIEIHGNKSIPDSLIKNILYTKIGDEYSEYLVTKYDGKRIINFYEKEGFSDTKIDSVNIAKIQNGLYQLNIYINEGWKIFFNSITLIGLEEEEENYLKKEIINKIIYKPYSPNILDNLKNKIEEMLNNKGYLYPEIWFEKNFSDKNKLEITVNVEKGKIYKVSDIIIKNVNPKIKVRDAIIKKELKFKKGDIITPEKLLDTQSSIYELGLFKDVNINYEIIDNSDSLCNIYIILDVMKQKWLEFLVGYSSKPALRGGVTWGHDNLWDNGQRFAISLFTEYGRLFLKNKIELRYGEYRLLGTKWKLSSKVYFDRAQYENEYNQLSIGMNFGLNRDLTTYTAIAFGFNYERSKFSNVKIDSTINGKIKEGIVRTNSFTTSLINNHSDNLLNPLEGYYHRIHSEFAGLILGGNEDYLRLEYNYHKYGIIKKPFNLAFRLKAGSLIELKKNSVNNPEHYFSLGGSNSFRAKSADLLGIGKYSGYNLGLITFEIRKVIYKSWGIVIFNDNGFILKKDQNFDYKNILYCYGLGLRYLTKIGPIRIDYGILSGNFFENIKKGQLYISIGQAF